MFSKLFYVLILIVVLGRHANAQVALAKLKFEKAEEAYNDGKYQDALNNLDEAQRIFGKSNAPIHYLRVICRDRLLSKSYLDEIVDKALLSEECASFLALYADNANLSEKYREVYEISGRHKSEHLNLVKRAIEGNADAQYQVAKLYDSQGYASASAKALLWFTKAAHQGHDKAMVEVAIAYNFKAHATKADTLQAIKWYTKAAAKNNGQAMYRLGRMAKTDSEALQWYQKAAAVGDDDGIREIGGYYQEGKGVAQDYQKALEWYLKAAAKSDAVSMNKIGELYLEGLGVAQDTKEARKWFSKAVVSGKDRFGFSSSNMGMIYYKGLGVEKDPLIALVWFLEAYNINSANGAAFLYSLFAIEDLLESKTQFGYAKLVPLLEDGVKKNNKSALLSLGTFYENGFGVTQNLTLARTYYRRAAEQDYYSAASAFCLAMTNNMQ